MTTSSDRYPTYTPTLANDWTALSHHTVPVPVLLGTATEAMNYRTHTTFESLILTYSLSRECTSPSCLSYPRSGFDFLVLSHLLKADTTPFSWQVPV